MAIRLDTLEQRIVGVLIEKEMTVPDSYPLTLSALVAGCNQKSNREPQMHAEDFEVEGALRALMDRDWVTRYEREGGRVQRYAHQAREQLGVGAPDLAILSELLCRGPQSPGELKSRTARMSAFASPAEVEARLQDLATRAIPYVVELPRRPREKMRRWSHLLDGSAPDEAISAVPSEPKSSWPVARTPTPAPPASAPDGTLAERVAALEEEVRTLRDDVDRLMGR